MTWGGLSHLVTALSDGLDGCGIGTGASVACLIDNDVSSIAIAIAILASDRCLVVLPAIGPLPPLHEVSIGGPPAAVVVDLRRDETTDLIHQARACGCAVLGVDDAGCRVMAALGGAPDIPGASVIARSSGTTGPPKPIGLSDQQLWEALNSSGRLHCPDAHRHPALLAHPAAHIAGLWTVLSSVASASYLVVLPRFEPTVWARTVMEHQVRAAFLVPTALRDLFDAHVPRSHLASLALISSGAAPCLVEVARSFIDRYDIPLLHTYGATEFAGAVAGWTLDTYRRWWPAKAGSAGQAYPRVELRVVNDHGERAGPDQVGALEVRTPQAATREWVRTADLARLDRDGFLWVIGRADRAIHRGGFTIVPERVEKAIRSHQAVRDVVVTARPDSRLGQVPVGLVETHQGSQVSEEELRRHCLERLGNYEVPVQFVLGTVPRDRNGKVCAQDLNPCLDSPVGDKVAPDLWRPGHLAGSEEHRRTH